MSSPKCTVCNADAPLDQMHKQCVQCKSAVYCSAKCQTKDWKHHKHICKTFAEFMATVPRPSDNHRLVIVFPVGEEKVEVAWTPLSTSGFSAETGGHLGSSAEMLSVTGHLSYTTSTFQARRLDHSLLLFYRHMFEGDGSQPNLSVEKVMSGRQQKTWRGPLVVIRNSDPEDGVSDEVGTIQDITLSDFPLIVQFLKSFGNGKTALSLEERCGRAMRGEDDSQYVTGVRISCEGQMKFLGVKKYRSYEVYNNDAIWKLSATTISSLLGVSLIIVKDKVDWEGSIHLMNFNPDRNSEGALLCMSAQATKEVLAKLGEQPWNTSPGDVIVIRQDKKPITPEQVEVLGEFIPAALLRLTTACKEVVRVAEVEEGGLAPENAQAVYHAAASIEAFSKGNFQEFFETYKKKKIHEGKGQWANVISLYDV